jgi:hypothetical protein
MSSIYYVQLKTLSTTDRNYVSFILVYYSISLATNIYSQSLLNLYLLNLLSLTIINIIIFLFPIISICKCIILLALSMFVSTLLKSFPLIYQFII